MPLVSKRNNSISKNNNIIATRLGDQFQELKEKLRNVTEDEWDTIPDVGDYSLKYKQKRREDVFTGRMDGGGTAASQQYFQDDTGHGHLAYSHISQDLSLCSWAGKCNRI